MNKIIRTLLTAVATTTLLFAAGTASAHDWDHDRRDRHEWRGDDWRDHGHRHWRERRHEERHARYRDHRTVVTERIVVRERPIYRHYESRPVYAEPGIVVGFNLPPLIIPLR